MLTVVEDEKTIRKAERTLIRAFKDYGAKQVETTVGYPSGSVAVRVHWVSELALWISSSNEGESHFWNSFGTQNPTLKKTVAISSEINLPFRSINRRIGGALAVDGAGRLLLLHRGKIGGGRHGVGATLFWENFGGKQVDVLDGDRETRMAVVCDFGSPRMVRQIHWFVTEVVRIKLLRDSVSRDGVEPTGFAIRDFKEEFHGTRRYERTGTVEAAADHGLIVGGLRSELTKLGYETGNDQFRDLYVHADQVVTSLFEVKPDVARASIYSAIGQLFLHSLDIEPVPARFLVIPRLDSVSFPEKLRALGIEIITFEWVADQPVFSRIRNRRF